LDLAEALELADDAGDHALDALRLHRPLADGGGHRAGQFLAVERHLAARLLDDRQFAQLHPLKGGEAAAAAVADAATADGARVFGRAAVLHLGVVIAAIGTAHQQRLPAMVALPQPPLPSSPTRGEVPGRWPVRHG